MSETREVISQQNNETRAVLPAESTHFYFKDGRPCYEVEAKKGGMRATTIADARKLDLVPSVTNILNIAAKPGLEAWKAKQILEASLTLPRIDGESLDDYAVRVVEDSKAQSKKAMGRGTQLHAAIEQWIQNEAFDSDQWSTHIRHIVGTLDQHGIDIRKGKAEHSFASPLFFGGKIDFQNNDPLVLDFKSKEKIEPKKQLSFDNHIQQLAAYGFGMGWEKFRALNVFVGVEDREVRVLEYEWSDICEAWEQFKLLLCYWKRIKKFGEYAVK